MEYMESLYTETLQELLENQGYGTENQSQSLTEILNLMDKFPDFVFGVNITLSMKALFLDKYDIREIGAETEQLFMHYWREKTQELIIDYVPKIDMWLNHFKDLFKFTVKLELEENIEKSKTENTDTSIVINDDTLRKSTYYLNPVNANTSTLRPQEVSETNNENDRTDTLDKNVEGEETKDRTMSKDVLQSVWGKTRAQLMKQIFELQSIYSECLHKFETIFMGVL